MFTHQTILALSGTLIQLPLQAGLEDDPLLLLSDLSWMEKDKKVQQPVHHLVDLLAVARLSSHLSLGPSHVGWQMRIALHNIFNHKPRHIYQILFLETWLSEFATATNQRL